MAVTNRNCSTCGEERPFEQPHPLAGQCPDEPAGECPEWICVECGAAILVDFAVPPPVVIATAPSRAA